MSIKKTPQCRISCFNKKQNNFIHNIAWVPSVYKKLISWIFRFFFFKTKDEFLLSKEDVLLWWFCLDLHKVINLPFHYHHSHISLKQSVKYNFQHRLFVKLKRTFKGTSFDISNNLFQNIRN